jgi:hypothetical protein
MSWTTAAASLFFWGGLATASISLPEIARFPVIHQGTLTINGVKVPAVVHFDADNKIFYIVVVRMGRDSLEALIAYEVPMDTLVPKEIWHHPSVES